MDDTTQPIRLPPPHQAGASPAPASRLLRMLLVGAGGHDDATAAGGGVDAPGTAGQAHGPNLPPVAAAGDDERARAKALWKASVAGAERWRDPAAAAAAGFRFRDEDKAGRSPAGTPTSPAGTPTPGPSSAGPSTAPAPRAGPPPQRRDDARLVHRRPGHRLARRAPLAALRAASAA